MALPEASKRGSSVVPPTATACGEAASAFTAGRVFGRQAVAPSSPDATSTVWPCALAIAYQTSKSSVSAVGALISQSPKLTEITSPSRPSTAFSIAPGMSFDWSPMTTFTRTAGASAAAHSVSSSTSVTSARASMPGSVSANTRWTSSVVPAGR